MSLLGDPECSACWLFSAFSDPAASTSNASNLSSVEMGDEDGDEVCDDELVLSPVL